MRKWLAALILVSVLPVAMSYSAQLDTVDQSATRDDPAEFQVLVNEVQETGTFRVSLSGPHLQRFYVEDAKKIESGDNGSIKIEATPEENAIQQRYGFTAYLREVTDSEFIEMSGAYYVQRDRDFRFVAVDTPESVGPGENMSSQVTVRSLSGATIEDYRVEMDVFNSTYTRSSSPVIPGGERTLDFDLEVPFKEPGNFNISYSLYTKGELDQVVNRTVKIEEVKNIRYSTDTSDGILGSSRVLNARNTGNIPSEIVLNTSYSSYLTPLVAFSEEPTRTSENDSVTFYHWNKSLDPDEDFTVEARVSYWIPALMVLLSIISVFGVRRISSDLDVSKEAEMVSGELKISIRVKNTSRNIMNTVTIQEFVPDIADVISEFEMARPNVRRTSDGTELEWDVGNLSPGESAIVQYRVTPRVRVEGGVELKPAEIYVEGGKKTETAIESVEFAPE